MKIKDLSIQNFRLLENVKLCLEDDTTLIVGRNNSGKTSLTELFRRLLTDSPPKFRLEDFSLETHERFWEALAQFRANKEVKVIRQSLPTISVSLTVEYGNEEELGTLCDFIVDLDETCITAKVVVTYELPPGKISDLFYELEEDRAACFRALRDRVPKLFVASIRAEDPNDPTNTKDVESTSLGAFLQFGFVNAQRTLDDASNKEKAVLGKVFERLFASATSAGAGSDEQEQAEALKAAVEEVQSEINTNFNTQLRGLAPTFELFGYPGLADPQLRTETLLDVKQLLSNHTTVGYQGPVSGGVNLPESYNGLGSRNLIFILLKLFEFFRDFTTRQPESGIHLIFIEEPEAHLHPQMQAVFIRKLNEIRRMFENNYNDGKPWPVQFVVTTHSSHIANEAPFDAMRYFLARPREAGSEILSTQSKNLRIGLRGEEADNHKFLQQYMTLTRCDLLFADAAILIEGTTERLLLPKIIEKFDQDYHADLGARYLSVMEVGGAYAHLFYNLVDFLGLRTLIITDVDSIDENNNRSKCKVSEGTHSSNAAINRWFDPGGGNDPALADIQAKSEAEKTNGVRRLAYQVPHKAEDACGRSFEDAFMLANPTKFGISGKTARKRESQAWGEAAKVKKSEFALTYAIRETDWIIPRYIDLGLNWLAKLETSEAEQLAGPAQEAADA